MSERGLASRGPWVPTPAIFEINDYAVGFYVGRDVTNASPFSHVADNWVDAGAWGLGGATYAIYRGKRAVVYDTTTLPELGAWVRSFLQHEKGIEEFLVVLSHWHLDHIAGNGAYESDPIIALAETRATLAQHRAAIEVGDLWGPPAFDVVLPNVTFRDRLDVYLDDLTLEFHHFNIHSRDANLLYIPSHKLLFPGDALEDTVTYVIEPQELATHLVELERLKTFDVQTIYPNHGNPAVIREGGYTKALIDAVIEYDSALLRRAHEPGFLSLPIEDFISNALAGGVVSLWEPYRAVHENNLRTVHEYHRERSVSPKLQ